MRSCVYVRFANLRELRETDEINGGGGGRYPRKVRGRREHPRHKLISWEGQERGVGRDEVQRPKRGGYVGWEESVSIQIGDVSVRTRRLAGFRDGQLSLPLRSPRPEQRAAKSVQRGWRETEGNLASR